MRKNYLHTKAEPDFCQKVKEYAEKCFSGNVSQAIREALQTAMDRDS